MSYRTVEESSLTGIADAIREAGGTGESLLFPDDFLTAISNMGGTGGTLTVTAPAGSTVTVSKDGKTLTRVAGADGIVVFRGLQSGTWMLSITDDTQTASKTVKIVADYATSITFFAATINITYPSGSTCTATDGTTTLTAPDTSGTWACVVPNAGTWTVSITNNAGEKSKSVTITSNGQTANCILGAPSDYQEVVYLQSTGTQYIDTLLTGKTYRFRVTAKASFDAVGGVLYGEVRVPYMVMMAHYSGNMYATLTYNGDGVGDKLDAGTIYNLDKECSADGILTVKNDGAIIATYNASSQGFDNNRTYRPFIFSRNNGNSADTKIKAKLYRLTIYDTDGTTPLREFVPCYRKSDSVAGLYDLVNGVFYTNAGSGTFVVGGNV